LDNHKVAVFIDFDNIRIGVRQHFGAEISPRKLMEKAARYGSVLEAKAYADFTEYAREFSRCMRRSRHLAAAARARPICTWSWISSPSLWTARTSTPWC
jgi:hypothetical protein